MDGWTLLTGSASPLNFIQSARFADDAGISGQARRQCVFHGLK